MYDSYLFLFSSWILAIGNIAYDVETIVNGLRLWLWTQDSAYAYDCEHKTFAYDYDKDHCG